MKNNNETDALHELIIAEKLKHTLELKELKDQFNVAYDSVRPINIVKSLFHEVTASPEIKSDLINNAIGLGTGFMTKTLLLGFSNNLIKKALGTLFEFSVATVVTKHSEKIKLVGRNLFNYFKRK
jgi:hypothetical protein